MCPAPTCRCPNVDQPASTRPRRAPRRLRTRGRGARRERAARRIIRASARDRALRLVFGCRGAPGIDMPLGSSRARLRRPADTNPSPDPGMTDSIRAPGGPNDRLCTTQGRSGSGAKRGEARQSHCEWPCLFYDLVLRNYRRMIWRPSIMVSTWRVGDRMSNRWSRQPYMIWSVAVARQRIGNASPRPLRKLGHARSSRRSSGHVLIGLTSALVSATPNLGLRSSWRSHPPMVSWEGCTRRAVVWAVACARRTSRSEALSLGSYGPSPSDRLPPWS